MCNVRVFWDDRDCEISMKKMFKNLSGYKALIYCVLDHVDKIF